MNKIKIGNKTIGEKKSKGFQKGNNFGISNKGRLRDEKWLENQRKSRLGKHYSYKTEFIKGRTPWNKGKLNPSAKKLSHAFKKGQRPHNWKGGVSPFRAQVRSCLAYRIWRSDIFGRDNYTCQMCNKKGGYLNADHYPIPFSKIMNDLKIKTMKEALLCEILWEIGNGRTLCKECHKKITWNK